MSTAYWTTRYLVTTSDEESDNSSIEHLIPTPQSDDEHSIMDYELDKQSHTWVSVGSPPCRTTDREDAEITLTTLLLQLSRTTLIPRPSRAIKNNTNNFEPCVSDSKQPVQRKTPSHMCPHVTVGHLYCQNLLHQQDQRSANKIFQDHLCVVIIIINNAFQDHARMLQLDNDAYP